MKIAVNIDALLWKVLIDYIFHLKQYYKINALTVLKDNDEP